MRSRIFVGLGVSVGVIGLAGAGGCRRSEPGSEAPNASAPPPSSTTAPQAGAAISGPEAGAATGGRAGSGKPMGSADETRPARLRGGATASPPAETKPTAPRPRPELLLPGSSGPGPGPFKPAAHINVRVDDALDTAVRDVLARWGAIQSVSAKMKMVYDQTRGLKQRRLGEGSYDLLKKDGETLIRMENLESMIVERAEDDQILTGERMLRIYDGEFLYSLQELHSSKTAVKSRPKPGEIQYIGGPNLIFQIRSFDHVMFHSVKARQEGPAYVFKATRSAAGISAEFSVDPTTGLLRQLKTEVNREGRAYTLTLTFTDIVLNPSFPKDHFTFTPPEGVELLDRTQPEAAEAPGGGSP